MTYLNLDTSSIFPLFMLASFAVQFTFNNSDFISHSLASLGMLDHFWVLKETVTGVLITLYCTN